MAYFDELYSFADMYKAYKSCKRNKANNINAIKFDFNFIDNIWLLLNEINNLSYIPRDYQAFLVQTPKMREVFASEFRDRIVHHLLVNDLESIFEPIFIYDSYACRKNKGTHKAMLQAQKFSRKTDNYYYLQLDIKNFFLSIDKDILFERVKKIVLKRDKINAKRILFLAEKIIYDIPKYKFSFRGDFKKHIHLPKHKSLLYTPDNKGLPIGNLTSQFFANVYLDMLDNYIKRTLKVKHYIRYVDDFVLFGKSKEELLSIKNLISHFLTTLKLELRESYRLRKINTGIDFLGYVTRPNYILVRNRVVNNFKQKRAWFLDSCFIDGECNLSDAKHFKQINASYYGHFKHAHSYQLRKKYFMEEWL